MKKTLKIPATLYRTGTSVVGKDGEMELSISSDTPYKRYDWYNDEEYYEVLRHTPDGMDATRLKAGAALLFNHDRDIQLGTINAPELRDGKCYVKAKLSAAADVSSFRTRIEEGILKDTSVGYQITDEGECIGARDGCPVYEFSWAVHEASMVTIPADITVGVGRTREEEAKSEMREISVEVKDDVDNANKKGDTNLTKKTMKVTSLLRNHIMAADKGAPGGGGGNETEATIDVAAERKAAREEFKARCKKIDEYVEAIKNPKWKEAARLVAVKHKDGDAEFEAFRSDANNAIDALTSRAMEGESQHGGLEIVGDRPQRMSMGAQFIRSKEFKAASGMPGRRSAAIELDYSILGIRGKVTLAQRAGFTSSDLSPVNVQIQTGVIGLGVQRLTIMDMIAPGTTGAAAIIYPQESSFGTLDGVAFSTSAGVMPKAGTVGERGIKPLWEPDLTTVTANVRKVAVTTKVPDEFMADFPALQSYIDERMPYMVDTRTEEQILYGDGIGNNLKGIFTFAGVQTRAITTTSDATIAASLRQGLTDVSVGSMFEPDGYAFHPYDWETAQLLKDTNGRFLAGGPYYIPYTNGVFMELHTFWGKPCVITTAVSYGRPLAGSWKLGAQYFIRDGMRLEMTNANEDDFRRNLICIRAEHRLGLACYRPVAFIEFTAFPARA